MSLLPPENDSSPYTEEQLAMFHHGMFRFIDDLSSMIDSHISSDQEVITFHDKGFLTAATIAVNALEYNLRLENFTYPNLNA